MLSHSHEASDDCSASSFDYVQVPQKQQQQQPAEDVQEQVLTKPKKPPTAYNYFFKVHHQMLMGSHPSFSGQTADDGSDDGKKNIDKNKNGVRFASAARMVSKMWKEADNETRAYYEELAAKDVEKYKKDLKAWENQQMNKIRSCHTAPAFLATLAKAAPTTTTGPAVPVPCSDTSDVLKSLRMPPMSGKLARAKSDQPLRKSLSAFKTAAAASKASSSLSPRRHSYEYAPIHNRMDLNMMMPLHHQDTPSHEQVHRSMSESAIDVVGQYQFKQATSSLADVFNTSFTWDDHADDLVGSLGKGEGHTSYNRDIEMSISTEESLELAQQLGDDGVDFIINCFKQ